MFEPPVCTKIVYQTRQEAQKQANGIMRRSHKTAVVYLCSHCEYYHLTSQPHDSPDRKAKRRR